MADIQIISRKSPENIADSATKSLNRPDLKRSLRIDFFNDLNSIDQTEQRNWHNNPDFIKFIIKSLRPNDTYYLPASVSVEEFKKLIEKWNTSQGRRNPVRIDSVSQEDIVSTLQSRDIDTHTIIRSLTRYDRALADKFSGQTFQIQGIFGPSIKHPLKLPTDPRSDKEFQSWVTKKVMIEKDPKFITRLIDSKVSQDDLNWLVDRYNESHRLASLCKPSLSPALKNIPINDIFNRIKIERAVPSLSENLVPVAFYYSGVIPKEVLNPLQIQVVDRIERAYKNAPLTISERQKLLGEVAALTPFVKGDCAVAQLRCQHLIDAIKEVRKEILVAEKGSDKTKTAALKKREAELLEFQKKLPSGTASARNARSFQKESFLENGAVDITSAKEKIYKSFKDSVFSEQSAANPTFWNDHKELADKIPNNTDGRTLLQIMSKSEWKVAGVAYNKALYTKAALSYLNTTAENQQGLILPDQMAAARAIMNGDAARLAKTSGALDPESHINQPLVLAEGAKAHVEGSKAIDEAVGKGVVIGAQLGATATAIYSGQIELLPVIWAAPYLLATGTRSYVEYNNTKDFTKNIADAACKEWKLNKFFGSPGQVLGSYLPTNDENLAKCFLLDVVSLGALDLAVGSRLASTLKRGSILTPEATAKIQALAKNRFGKNLSDSQLEKTISGLSSTYHDDILMKRIFDNANLSLEGRQVPENLRALLNKLGGRLTPDAPIGIHPSTVVAMDQSHFVAKLSNLPENAPHIITTGTDSKVQIIRLPNNQWAMSPVYKSSTNGTMVFSNGKWEPITNEHPIYPGSSIGIDNVKFNIPETNTPGFEGFWKKVLDGQPCTIGRGSTCDIHLEGDGISRIQATITYDKNIRQLYISDGVASSSGVSYKEGKFLSTKWIPIDRKTVLPAGTTVQFGSHNVKLPGVPVSPINTSKQLHQTVGSTPHQPKVSPPLNLVVQPKKLEVFANHNSAVGVTPKSIGTISQDTASITTTADGKTIIGIFDGVGSSSRAEQASLVAANATNTELHNGRLLPEAIQNSHYEARNASSGQTTACVAVIDQNGYLRLVGVGDSEALVIKPNNTYTRISKFHLDATWERNVSNENYDLIQHDFNAFMKKVISGDKTAIHDLQVYDKSRNVIDQALGGSSAPTIKQPTVLKLDPGDKVVVVSDGISDVLSGVDITKILREAKTPQQAVEDLIAAASNPGSSKHSIHGVTVSKDQNGRYFLPKKDDRSAAVYFYK